MYVPMSFGRVLRIWGLTPSHMCACCWHFGSSTPGLMRVPSVGPWLLWGCTLGRRRAAGRKTGGIGGERGRCSKRRKGGVAHRFEQCASYWCCRCIRGLAIASRSYGQIETLRFRSGPKRLYIHGALLAQVAQDLRCIMTVTEGDRHFGCTLVVIGSARVSSGARRSDAARKSVSLIVWVAPRTSLALVVMDARRVRLDIHIVETLGEGLAMVCRWVRFARISLSLGFIESRHGVAQGTRHGPPDAGMLVCFGVARRPARTDQLFLGQLHN